MAHGAQRTARRGELGPVEHRGAWIGWGLALETVGVGIPVAVALGHASRDGPLGSITHYTVRLVWHEMLRSHADVALLVLGVLIFVAGAIALARPFVARRSTLLIGVPVMAIGGLALLGVLALLIAVLVALAESPGGGPDGFGGVFDMLFDLVPEPRRKRRRPPPG